MKDDLNNDIYAVNKVNTSREQHLISSRDMDGYISKVVESVTEDNDRVKESIVVQTTFNFYNSVSGYVDDANNAVMSARYSHRIVNYRVSVLCFTLSMIVHNARVLYCRDNDVTMSQIEFARGLASQIFKLDSRV